MPTFWDSLWDFRFGLRSSKHGRDIGEISHVYENDLRLQIVHMFHFISHDILPARPLC